MSLFVAVRPDDAASEDLQHALERVRRLPVAQPLHWQPPALWHLTLAFLGNPPDDVDDEVVERLEALGGHAVVPDVRLAGAGCFGRHVLWVGLMAGPPVDALGSMAAAIPRLVHGSGAVVDRRPWRAHLTLARARNGDARAAAGLLTDYRGPSFSVDEVLLIRSTGGPHPSHQVIQRLPLVRKAPPRSRA
jgi:2'-5' RNA ligase